MFEAGSHLTKRCLVFGCGNPLFGDDGFGAQVIEYLTSHHKMPRHVACLDIGTAIRDLLFDILLSPQKPEQIIIVDAMSLAGGVPGQIYEIDVDQIQAEKISDFSLHQFPTTNMLKEIKEGTDIEVRVLVAQIAEVPDEVRPGLSPAVAAAVPEMCRRIMEVVDRTPLSQPIQSGESV
ncbi:MAG: hydrogenase maturation protease [Desulfatitalea sp.]